MEADVAPRHLLARSSTVQIILEPNCIVMANDTDTQPHDDQTGRAPEGTTHIVAGRPAKNTVSRRGASSSDCIAAPCPTPGVPLKTSAHGTPPSGQTHENHVAAVVVVCAPSLSKTMGALHPAGALYARPVHINQAREAHASFVSLLRRRGVEVHDVREILEQDADWSLGDRCRLEDLAADSLSYAMARDTTSIDVESTKHYVSDEYKRSVLREMDVSQLVDIVMTNPTVTITSTGRDTGFSAEYAFSPSTNIMFTRDQQVTTVNGVVMARLQATQRQQEVDILEFCLRKLGMNVLGRVEKGYLEGGDFFPCGRQLCFVGIGPRSTYAAVEWMMEKDMFGTDTVAVVRDEFDMSQDRMHLDCVFNIVDDKCCIMAENIIGKQEPNKCRTVDVWKKGIRQGGPQHGEYFLCEEESNVEFSAYLVSLGFAIIPVSADEQLLYGCNVLNLGNGQVIATERNSARRIATNVAFSGTVEYLDFSAVTAMFGGVQYVELFGPGHS